MRRVLYLCLHGQPGGAELYLASLLEAMDRTRVEPVVAVGSEGPVVARLRRRGIAVVVLPAMRFLLRGARSPATAAQNVVAYIRAMQALRRLLAEYRIDLIHANGEPAVKYAGMLQLVSARPVVCTLHEPMLPPLSRAHRWLLAATMRRFCDVVVVPSHANRDLLIRAGLPESKVLSLHNGVDPTRFDPSTDAGAIVRGHHGVAPDRPVIGMVARFEPIKGHDILLRALPLIRERHPRLRCIIAGDALFPEERPWKEAIHSLTAELRLQDCVEFSGWRDDVARHYFALDLLVHPCVQHDSLPTVILEAMAAGRPVVASAVGGIPEIVEDGVTGLLVKPGDPRSLADAVLALLDREDLRLRMGASARARVLDLFRWPVHVKALLEIYDRVTARAPAFISTGASS